MRFENFELESPTGNATLVGGGHLWDLHNFAAFEGFRFYARKNALELRWTASPADENPWGDPTNRAQGCILRFLALRLLVASERDPEMPMSEAHTLEAISKVVPGAEEETELKDSWAPDEQFALLLEFHDDRTVRIDCEVAQLEAIVRHG